MRLFLNILLCWPLVALPPANAAILIQGPDAPPLEYRAALKADPDSLSPSQALLKQRPASAQREALMSAFAAAQKSFLENSKEQAQLRFQEVVVMFPNEDWARADRQVFLHSFLRLAQMQIEIEKQNRWLVLALGTGDDISAESGLFPPPLLKTFETLRREVPRVQIPDYLFADGWTVVLVNGVACTKQFCQGFPINGPAFRVTYLSEVWQTVSAVAEATELKAIRPKRTPWVTGDCSKTQYSTASTHLKDARVFWGGTCEAAPAKPVNLQPVVQTEVLPRMEIKESAPAFYKSKWFWGSVAVAAVAAVLVNGQKKQKDEREPTTTYGY